MERLIALLCTTITVFTLLSPRADTDEIDLCELSSYPPTYDSRFPIDFGWIVDHYDFDWIEEYIDEYYESYYKHCERYLTSKQREIAGKFGLSNIVFKPDFRRYENTKVTFSKGIWGNRLLFRYLAPVGDLGDFELFVALKPHRFVTFIAKGRLNGEESIAIMVSRPFGSEKENRDMTRRTRRLLRRVKRLVD